MAFLHNSLPQSFAPLFRFGKREESDYTPKQVKADVMLSPESVSTKADTIITSPHSVLGSATATSIQTSPVKSPPVADVNNTKVYSVKKVSSPSAVSNHSSIGLFFQNTSLPPHQGTFDAILHFVYTNDKYPLLKELEVSLDNLFGALKNVHFLGLQSDTNGNDSQEDGVYDLIIEWIISKKLAREVMSHPMWKEKSVSLFFIKKLFSEIKEAQRAENERSRRSLSNMSVKRNKTLTDFITDLEMLRAILWWCRIDPVAASDFRIREEWAMEDVLSYLDFSAIPKEEFLKELGQHSSATMDESNGNYIVSDDTAAAVISCAFSQYEAQKKVAVSAKPSFKTMLRAWRRAL